MTELSKKIGMSRRGLYSALENKTLKIGTLEKISEAIGVPITEFVELHELIFPKYDNDEKVKLMKRITELEEQLEDKNELLEYYRAKSEFQQLFEIKHMMYFDEVYNANKSNLDSESINQEVERKIYSDPEIINLLKIRDKILAKRGKNEGEF